jgi:hypothetical protein
MVRERALINQNTSSWGEHQREPELCSDDVQPRRHL